ncbi:MAG: nitroreductase family protein [Actinobacteria bacterium]|nr:nitroreductase family protein [Actinomycetota bacterium]
MSARDFSTLVSARRATRAFLSDPVPTSWIDDIIDLANRAPSAGNTQGWDFLVLDTPESVATFWDTSLPVERRSHFPWPELLAAPVLVIPICRPQSWVERYAEGDKAKTGLGRSAEDWSVPYWWIDTAFAAMTIQLAAQDRNLGTLFFGLFERERTILDRFSVPTDRRALGAIAIGHPAPQQRRSSSTLRRRRSAAETTHRNAWEPTAS